MVFLDDIPFIIVLFCACLYAFARFSSAGVGSIRVSIFFWVAMMVSKGGREWCGWRGRTEWEGMCILDDFESGVEYESEIL